MNLVLLYNNKDHQLVLKCQELISEIEQEIKYKIQKFLLHPDIDINRRLVQHQVEEVLRSYSKRISEFQKSEFVDIELTFKDNTLNVNIIGSDS